jgi:hypothetical protein
LTVNGTGFVNGSVVYANYSPQATTYVSATQLTVARFSPMPDSGADGTIPIGVVKQSGEKISNTVNFTAGVASGTNYNETGRGVTIVSTVAVTDTYHAGATPSAVRFNAGTMKYSRSASGLGASFTITFWAKIAVDRNALSCFFCQDNAASNYYMISTLADGTTLRRDTSGGGNVSSGVSMAVGTWFFVGCVNDTSAGPGTDIFGWKIAGGSWTTAVTNANQAVSGPADANTMYLGGDGFGTSDFLNGSLAAVKIWTVALTEAEIQAEAATYAPVKTANLWANYKFNAGPQTTDDSGNGRTLTQAGTPVLDSSGPPIT